jgi:cell division protease FtsH
MAEKQNYSEEVAKQIDLEIERIIKECYEDAKKTLSKFRKYLDSIANSLIEKEVLEFEEFSELVKDIVVARGEKARKV